MHIFLTDIQMRSRLNIIKLHHYFKFLIHQLYKFNLKSNELPQLNGVKSKLKIVRSDFYTHRPSLFQRI